MLGSNWQHVNRAGTGPLARSESGRISRLRRKCRLRKNSGDLGCARPGASGWTAATQLSVFGSFEPRHTNVAVSGIFVA